MSDIPQEAVEAAARAWWERERETYWKRVPWEDLGEEGQDFCRANAHAALSTAAPYLVAAAEARGRKQAAEQIVREVERAINAAEDPFDPAKSRLLHIARIARGFAAEQDTPP